MNRKAKLAIALGALTLAAAHVPSQAATVTYNLQRTSALTNVDDASGRWQFDGGRVRLGNVEVGRYISKKRVAFGPPAYNKAAVETTIIWRWGNHAFTLQGSHLFSSGDQVGGVSANSSGFSAYEDATYTRTGANITVTY